MSNLLQMLRALAISALFVSVGSAETTNNLIIAHFQPAKTNYFLGEPITVYLTVSSQYTNTINIDNDSFLMANFSLGYDGGTTSKASNIHRGVYIGFSQDIPLVPKGQFKKIYYINKSLKVEEPGKYCVDCAVGIKGRNPNIKFAIPPQCISTQDYLTTKREEPHKGDPGFCFATSPGEASNAISVQVNDKIAFSLTKGSPEQLRVIYAELLEEAKTLREKNPEAQYNEPVLALSSVRDPLVVPHLINAMMIAIDPISELSIIQALEEIKTPEAIKGLTGIDVTAPRTLFLKRDVAEAFGRLKVKEGIPFLTKLLSDNDDETQIRAIHALGQIGTAECLDAIRKKTGNFKGKVKDTAVEVLKKSSPAKDGEGSSPAKQ